MYCEYKIFFFARKRLLLFEKAADAFADDFDFVSTEAFAFSCKNGITGTSFFEPFCGEFTGFDTAERFFHAFFDVSGEDEGTVVIFTPFSGVGDDLVHALDAAFINEVNDEFCFVDTFKVSHFGGISGFGKNFKTVFHEINGTAAENVLFTEEVFVSFLFHGAFENASTGETFSFGESESNFAGFAGAVLADSDQAGNTEAFDEAFANFSTGAFGSDHDDVDVSGGDDFAENISKTM